MKVLAIVGSARREGNTELLTRHALDAVAAEGIDTELILLSGLEIGHCTGCLACETQGRCIIEDDLMPIYEKMLEADGIILASPVYFGAASSLIKALMDRTGYIARYQGNAFRGKAGGPLVVGRRAGMNFAFAQMNFWFQILGFFMTGAQYWNVAFGRNKGEVESDAEGIATVKDFATNLSFMLKKLND